MEQTVNTINVEQASNDTLSVDDFRRQIQERSRTLEPHEKVIWKGNDDIEPFEKLTPFLKQVEYKEQEGSNNVYAKYSGVCPDGCKSSLRKNRTLRIEYFGGVQASLRGWCTECNLAGSRLLDRVMSKVTVKATEPDKATDTVTGIDGKPMFKTYSLDDVEAFDDIQWLVQNVLQCSTTSLFYGDSNTGKTFVGLDIALRVAMGLNWQGRQVQPGRVLYIYAEGKLGLKQRWQAWKKHYNGTGTDKLHIIPCPVHLTRDREELINVIENLTDVPVLVVIDTFSMCAPDTNENAANEVSKVLEVANYIKRTYGSHVMVVHHAGKNGDYRGSAAFKGNVDAMIELLREDETSPIRLHCKKQRDGEYFKDIWLELKTVEVGFNDRTMEPITSCVVVGTDKPGNEHTGTQVQKVFSVLNEKGIEGLKYTEWLNASGLTKNAFNEARSTLVRLGRVSNKYDDTRYRAV